MVAWLFRVVCMYVNVSFMKEHTLKKIKYIYLRSPIAPRSVRSARDRGSLASNVRRVTKIYHLEFLLLQKVR
jgi:hypothetical protein